jgi:hypothetical protein
MGFNIKILGALAALIPLFIWISGCGQTNISPLGMDLIPQQVKENGLIWRNGSFGTFGDSRISFAAHSGQFYSTVNVVDGINGDKMALLIDGGAAGPAPALAFTISPAVDASAFYSNGHFQFDLASDSSGGSVNLTEVEYNADWLLSGFVPPTVNSESFVHYSLPLSSLGANTTNALSLILIQCSSYGVGNGNYLINDLKWTMD